jgi:hypothetical protein
VFDAVQYAFKIAEHIARRDPVDLDPTQAEPCRASPVVRKLVGMLVNPPVDLDGQPRFHAVEIEDAGTNRMLAAKSGSTQPPAAQGAPEDYFR